MDLVEAIADEFGIFLRADAREVGLQDRDLRLLLRQRSIVRVKHGAYALGSTWDAANERERHQLLARAVYRVVGRDAVLSHVSAVLVHTSSYWGLNLGSAHLTQPDGRAARTAAGVRQHAGRLAEGDVVDWRGMKVMSPVRAGLELTMLVDVERALVSVNGMLHDGLCDIKELRGRYESSMVYWPHSLRTDLVLRLADRRIESVGETRTFCLLWRNGFPPPEPQYEVFDDRGLLVGRVDFAWPELGIFLEFDGKEKYAKYLRNGEDPGDAVFREKKREDLIRDVTGWRCIRVTWADLENPAALLGRLDRAFKRAAA